MVWRSYTALALVLLFAGCSSPDAQPPEMPTLVGSWRAVLTSPGGAFPTTLFIGRDGCARPIHSGFAGPGTGYRYPRLVSELEGRIETLLMEPPPEDHNPEAAGS